MFIPIWLLIAVTVPLMALSVIGAIVSFLEFEHWLNLRRAIRDLERERRGF